MYSEKHKNIADGASLGAGLLRWQPCVICRVSPERNQKGQQKSGARKLLASGANANEMDANGVTVLV